MRKKSKIKRIIAGFLTTAILSTTIAVPTYAIGFGRQTTSNSYTEEEQKRNAIAMLNYLTVVNQEINASQNSKLYLEEVYSSLINNTSPNAIDDRTQIQLQDMLGTIDEYRMIDVKRERLQYIYEQNQAQAMREAIPSPLGLLSATQSFRLSSLIGSIVYMAVDSKKSYETASAQADMEYLQDGWALDDEGSSALNRSRENLFNYMVDMVQENKIPDEYALTENAVDEFVACKNNTNVSRRIQFLESHKSTYQNFGDYWILLASSYYENNDYEKCIDAVSEYENKQVQIFRNDHDLAEIMPLAIAASEEILSDEKKCVQTINHYVDILTSNIDTDDWALRYFAAQTYVDLYAKTDDIEYLYQAYSLTLDNVNYLIDEQRDKNTVYLSDIKEKEIPKGASDDEKKEIKKYNKMLKQERKTELPPVYEPLYLNCDLLFELANELNISESDRKNIEQILHGSASNEDLFLTQPLNSTYYFSDSMDDIEYNVVYEKGSVEIPVQLLSECSKITVSISGKENQAIIDDWEIDTVKRKEKDDISSFVAIFNSKEAKKYEYSDGDIITVKVTPVDKSKVPDVEFTFKLHLGKRFGILKKYEFEREE